MFTRQVAPGIELRQFAFDDAEPLFAVVERNRLYLREWLPWVDLTESARTSAASSNGAPSVRSQSGTADRHRNRWPDRGIGRLPSHRLAKQALQYRVLDRGRAAGTRPYDAVLRGLIDYLFDELLLHRVTIQCGTGNMRSCAIPERLGFIREGVMRQAEWVNDRWVDWLCGGFCSRTGVKRGAAPEVPG